MDTSLACVTLRSEKFGGESMLLYRYAYQTFSVWPKQLTADKGRNFPRHYGRNTFRNIAQLRSFAETVIYGRNGHFRPKMACFGLNLRTWWYQACLTHSGEYHHVQVRPQYMAEKSHFRPKMAVSAVNNSFGRKFSYGRNFGYGRISAFIELYLTVTAFWKKSSFGHTLSLALKF